ncbi:hypothetical protein Syn7502_03435 [Synechococcus sp. PCC 7502]|uniref:hypothetical protein n=1 Tax=Synechococcus sp. PCC 7502 TaxID=1173263 RepID=UPI00029F8B90|nr:hypothetical protein [Synechococcus sp. PCC 7502]AFY75284.1 hypothetical protein Syn7502_03435 [Synechococcus sp. PCC 7502]
MYKNAPELEPADYIVLGIANCFIKSDGEVLKVKVVEPIPSAALEAIWKQIPTSYELAYSTSIGEVLKEDGSVTLPSLFNQDVQICNEFAERAIAAARTYKNRPASKQFIPIGETYSKFNFSLDKKRVLNAERVVNTEDNVKQHSHTHKVL